METIWIQSQYGDTVVVVGAMLALVRNPDAEAAAHRGLFLVSGVFQKIPSGRRHRETPASGKFGVWIPDDADPAVWIVPIVSVI